MCDVMSEFINHHQEDELPESTTFKYIEHIFSKDEESEAYAFYLQSGITIERKYRGGEVVWIVMERQIEIQAEGVES